jgi:alpha-tubulin suppressor-like RCC1 family protein
VEHDRLDARLVARNLERTGCGRISQLDLAEFSSRYGSMLLGFAHLSSLSDKGTCLFSWGSNRMGECGQISSEAQKAYMEPVALRWRRDDHLVKQVACETGVSCVLLENGQLFSWGSSKHGKLAHERETAADGSISRIRAPQRVVGLEDIRVMQISCAASYAAAITEDGDLFTWGVVSDEDGAPVLGHRRGDVHGQLGSDGVAYIAVPTLVVAMRSHRVSQISCGPSHAAVVTARGLVYSWGSGDRGKLGLGSEADVWAPQRVTGLDRQRICQVSCGSVHTLAVTVGGAVYVWGGARSGKLGLGAASFMDTVRAPGAVKRP